jgi:hypothetical protein
MGANMNLRKFKADVNLWWLCTKFGHQRVYWSMLDAFLVELTKAGSYQEFGYKLDLIANYLQNSMFKQYLKDKSGIKRNAIGFLELYATQRPQLVAKVQGGDKFDLSCDFSQKMFYSLELITMQAVLYPGMKYIGQEQNMPDIDHREKGHPAELTPIWIYVTAAVLIFSALIGPPSGGYRGLDLEEAMSKNEAVQNAADSNQAEKEQDAIDG